MICLMPHLEKVVSFNIRQELSEHKRLSHIV